MKYARILMIFCIVVIACKKTGNTNANILFYNATWSLPAITASVNGTPVLATGLAQGQASGTAAKPYLALPAGTNEIAFNAGTTTLAKNNFYMPGVSGASFLFYDTSAKITSSRLLQLTDDLTAADTAQIKYRFINASPDTTAVDLWLVNGVKDSVRIVNAAAFAGRNAVGSSLETFLTQKYHGEAYTIKIKKANSAQVLAFASYTFTVRGIYTLVFSGLPSGTGPTAFKVAVLNHQTE